MTYCAGSTVCSPNLARPTASDHVFNQLGIGPFPIMLAPLAGVSDYPFRQICRDQGASLVYVEMLSAIALSYHSKNTMRMIHRHYTEDILGAQITAKDADHMSRGVAVLHNYPIDTIDINMGCPVRKVVKTGCGSALLRDPNQVYKVVKAACNHTDKIVSAKIRIGWSHDEAYPLEVASACEQAGARWLTVHGRLRSERYDAPVRLNVIKQIKRQILIPVIGNGNLFNSADIEHMKTNTEVDGVMISRGALGNPWVFQYGSTTTHNTTTPSPTSIHQWHTIISHHLNLTASTYGHRLTPALQFRKHLLWYFKGWPIPSQYKQQAQSIRSLIEAQQLIDQVRTHLINAGIHTRKLHHPSHRRWQTTTDLSTPQHHWDPKYDMDRKHDRGGGEG